MDNKIILQETTENAIRGKEATQMAALSLPSISGREPPEDEARAELPSRCKYLLRGLEGDSSHCI